VQRDAAIALLLGERVAALERLHAVQSGVEVRFVALQLLQADDVGALRGEPPEHALLRRRPYAIDVERDDSKAHLTRWGSWTRRRGLPTTWRARAGTSP